MQDAMVPASEVVAILTKATRRVSELPSPSGPEICVIVAAVVVVCWPQAVSESKRPILKCMILGILIGYLIVNDRAEATTLPVDEVMQSSVPSPSFSFFPGPILK
jgi:hypothetical protein